jgi:hypothetical protein
MEEKLTPYQQWKKDLGKTRPWDLLNPKTEYVDEAKAVERFDICKTCPFLIKSTNQCRKCGCFMHLKTKLAHAECPVGKW